MYTHRLRFQVTYGKAREAMKWAEDMNALAAERGWAKGVLWNVSFGPVNAFVMEWDYESLAVFEQETNAQYTDSSFMTLFRSANDFGVEGETATELLETVTTL